MDVVIKRFRCPKCSELLEFKIDGKIDPVVVCSNCDTRINQGVVKALTKAYETYNSYIIDSNTENELGNKVSSYERSGNNGIAGFCGVLVVASVLIGLGILFFNWIGDMGGKWTLYVCDETMMSFSGHVSCRTTKEVIPNIGNKDTCFYQGHAYMDMYDSEAFECGRKCEGMICQEVCNHKGECE